MTGHTEAAGSHLLNRAIFGIAVGLEHIASRILSPLTGIALATQTVHRNGQTLMRLFAYRAIGHRPAFKTPGNRLDRLDLIERNRPSGLFELQQTPQRRQALGLVVDQRGILFVDLIFISARRPLQQVNRLGVEEMVLTALPPLVVPPHIEGPPVGRDFGKRRLMTQQSFASDIFNTHALNLSRGPGEIPIDHFLIETHRLEYLGAAIALDRRDTHFGHHLDRSLDRRINIALFGFLVAITLEHILADHIVEPFKSHIGIDRLSTVTQQQTEVVHLARFTGFKRQANLGASLQPHQVVMHSSHGEQRRDRHVIRVDAPVGKDDQIVPRNDGRVDSFEKLIHRPRQARLAIGSFEENRYGHRIVAKAIDLAQLLQLVVFEDRSLQSDLATTLRLGYQQVALGTDLGLGRSDELLAQRIEWRIGNLSEMLFEIAVQQLRTLGQNRQRRIVAHRANRILEHLYHWFEKDAQVLESVAEYLLPVENFLVARQKRCAASLG